MDLNAVIFVSADGVSNIENVLDQSRWADEPIPPTAIVLDFDEAANVAIEKITAQQGKRPQLIDREFVLQVGQVVGSAGITSEDLIPRSVYADAVKAYIERWLPDTWATNEADITADLQREEYGKDGLVESTKMLFSKYRPTFKTDYDKMGVLQGVIANVLARHRTDENNEEIVRLRQNVVAVCDFIREALEKSRAATAKISATQRVKRIIYDFDRLNKNNVPITAVQKLFRRLDREVSPMGPDAEGFLKVVNASLSELDRLRSTGQEEISGDLWIRWHNRITDMKKNPLTATVDGGEAPKKAAETHQVDSHKSFFVV